MEDFERFPSGAEFKSSIIQGWLQKLGLRQNIDLLQELTSVASGDELAIFDASETGPNKTKKATVTNIATAIKSAAGLMAYADTRFKVGSFTRDMSVATGTQAVTGVGFQPRFIFGIASIAGGGTEMSIGFSNATTNGCAAWGHNVTANSWFRNGPFVVMYQTGAIFYVGSVQSLDSDGFTMSWTKTGAKTGTVTVDYVAFR